MRLELVTCTVRGKNFPIILTTTIYNSIGHCTMRLFFEAHAQRMLQPRSADTKMFCSKTRMSRISGYEKLQNRAARVITHSSYDISSNLLLDQLKWKNLSVNRLKQKAILMHKTLNGQTPQYLHEMFTSRRCQYPLWNSNGKLFLPKPNTDYLKCSFSYSGAILWNNLPESLRLSPSFTAFKSSPESLYSRRTDSHTATR